MATFVNSHNAVNYILILHIPYGFFFLPVRVWIDLLENTI